MQCDLLLLNAQRRIFLGSSTLMGGTTNTAAGMRKAI